jgi:hypothetical protein
MVEVTIPRSQYDIFTAKLVPGSGPHVILKNGVFDEQGNVMLMCEEEELIRSSISPMFFVQKRDLLDYLLVCLLPFANRSSNSLQNIDCQRFTMMY